MSDRLIAKVKSVSATLKFDPSEGLGENVSRLFLRRNKFHFNDIVFNFLSGEVIVDFKMFGLLVKNWIVAEFYTTLIIAIKVSWFVSQKSEFFK